MIGLLCGVRLDAWRARGTRDLPGLAQASRWIAAYLCSTGRRWKRTDAGLPPGAHVLGLRATSFAGLLAAMANTPALVDVARLPRRWRLALRALGIPTLDRPASEAVLANASVLVVTAEDGAAPEQTIEILLTLVA